MEYLMMTGGDMAVSKESLDIVLSYLRRSEVNTEHNSHL